MAGQRQDFKNFKPHVSCNWEIVFLFVPFLSVSLTPFCFSRKRLIRILPRTCSLSRSWSYFELLCRILTLFLVLVKQNGSGFFPLRVVRLYLLMFASENRFRKFVCLRKAVGLLSTNLILLGRRYWDCLILWGNPNLDILRCVLPRLLLKSRGIVRRRLAVRMQWHLLFWMNLLNFSQNLCETVWRLFPMEFLCMLRGIHILLKIWVCGDLPPSEATGSCLFLQLFPEFQCQKVGCQGAPNNPYWGISEFCWRFEVCQFRWRKRWARSWRYELHFVLFSRAESQIKYVDNVPPQFSVFASFGVGFARSQILGRQLIFLKGLIYLKSLSRCRTICCVVILIATFLLWRPQKMSVWKSWEVCWDWPSASLQFIVTCWFFRQRSNFEGIDRGL